MTALLRVPDGGPSDSVVSRVFFEPSKVFPGVAGMRAWYFSGAVFHGGVGWLVGWGRVEGFMSRESIWNLSLIHISEPTRPY